MNYKKIYAYRFKEVSREKKITAWTVISSFVYRKMNQPVKILEPGAGQCEFINSVPSAEKWAVDMDDSILNYAGKNVKTIIGKVLDVDLPKEYFDGIFVSNFLEHLDNQLQVAEFLEKMNQLMKKGGVVVVLGPNFKYCYKNYFDFADHNVILTELSVCEHLFGAGFEIVECRPKFLPISFRSRFPVSSFLIKMYLQMPFFWNFFGKQFLIVAKKT